jgi:hypothetical protein
MNASLTIHPSEITLRRPARANWLSRIPAFITSLFAASDDPAALRYAAAKYGGETD